MAVSISDMEIAVDFVSMRPMFENEAYYDKETGKILYYSPELEDEEQDELPEDVAENERYVPIPHQNELDLGKRLALDFACQHLPEDLERVDSIFRRRGAYQRFKRLLADRRLLEKWHEYQDRVRRETLKAWCRENGIEIRD
jgi:hypothetical protein